MQWGLVDFSSVVAALQQPPEYVDSICASLEKSLGAQVRLFRNLRSTKSRFSFRFARQVVVLQPELQ